METLEFFQKKPKKNATGFVGNLQSVAEGTIQQKKKFA